ncbi:hypothetical protein [Clostridium sp. BL8]|nr:hypothetical protein [Clostridium sp. BL8]
MESYLCDEKFIALIEISKIRVFVNGAEFFSAIFYFHYISAVNRST